MAFSIGLQLYSVRDEMKKDVEATLRRVKEIGYDSVEFAGYFDYSARDLRRLLDEIGLSCVSVHEAIGNFLGEGGDAHADYLKTLGVRYEVIPSYNKPSFSGDEGLWKQLIAEFNEVKDRVEARGIRLGYHNHDFEFTLSASDKMYERLFREIPGLDPEIDTCWVRYAGYDPAERIRMHKGHVELVHLKDFSCKQLAAGPVYALIDENGNPSKEEKKNNEFHYRPLGMGMQDFDAILDACRDCGTKYLIVEQDKSDDRPSLDAVAISREFLRSKGL